MTREEHNKYMRKYMRQYRKAHPEFVERGRKYIRQYMKKRKAESPWLSHYYWAYTRCNNPKATNYSRWGGRGIRLHLTKEEIEILYKRDGAKDMKRPSLHRINNDDNYQFSNCQFIETSNKQKIEAYALFDKDGSFRIAYPRKVMIEVYQCNYSNSEKTSIKEVSITIKRRKNVLQN